MRITLFYRGPLRAKASPAAKHEIRKKIHPQLLEAWKQKRTVGAGLYSNPIPKLDSLPIVRQCGDFRFVPFVNVHDQTVAELQLTLLRPEAPGRLFTTGGDIDNRLKTLLDALKVPSRRGELPPNTAPESSEQPFLCLLEDDTLISSISVATDRLLEPVSDRTEVVLFLQVTTRALAAEVPYIGMNP